MTTGTKEAVRLDDQHRYFYGEKRVPGFTEICQDLGIIKPNAFYTPQGREEGNALHTWLLFLAQGQEASEAPDDRIAGRVEGIRKFLRESSFKFVGGETIQYCAGLGYCCKPDLWGSIGGRTCVIEAKRRAAQKWHPLQTAAQRFALAVNEFSARQRFGLYLKDGDYRLIEHTDTKDEKRWMSIVSAYHAKYHYTEKP